MVINNFIQPYYGASYGINPYAGYNPYSTTNPYGSSMGYGGLPNTGYSPYGMNPYAQMGQSLANGLTAIFQALRNLKDGGGQNSTASSGGSDKTSQAKAADSQWQQCKGCSKS